MGFKVGVQLHPQVGSVDDLRAAWKAADAMGADSIWIWDHFFPLYGNPDAEHYEAYTLLAAMAVDTHQAQFGALVTCNSYRNPQLLADMARTIDLLSHGRFVLGIGSGWFERDYTEYGYEFGTAPSRLADLATALPLISDRLGVLNPAPEGDLPILIGGSGEKVTLRLVAEYADAWNTFGPPENFKHKNAVLDEWCNKLGRAPREVERTVAIQPNELDDLDAYVAAGADHFIVMVGAPYDLAPLEALIAALGVTPESPRLLPPGARPGFVGTLSVPGDLWWVCTDPTPLAGMAYPRRGAWEALAERGFRHVVDLTRDAAKYDPAPLESHAYELADLVVRRHPEDPDRDEQRIHAAADLVAHRWRCGEGVVVHCHGGRGRTGAVLGTALVRMGHDPDEIVEWLHGVQRTRGRRGWPEQAWQADVVRRAALRGREPA